MSEIIEIKPCPLCGGKAVYTKIGSTTHPKVELDIEIKCRSCRLYLCRKYTTVNEAIKAWNTRATPTVERLEEFLKEFLVNRANVFLKEDIPELARALKELEQ